MLCWAILHVEYNGDGLLVAIWVHLNEPSYKVRSRSCKKMPNFEMFNFEKQRPVYDAECPQESNGAICFSLLGLEPPKITFDCMTSQLSVMFRNKFSFWGSKIDVSIWNFALWWALATTLIYNTVFWKCSKFWILWPFLFIQKQKRCFWNFGGQNHKNTRWSSCRACHFTSYLCLVCVSVQ